MAWFSDGTVSIEVHNENEDETITNKVAQYPVQRGQPLVDHTQRESKTWVMSGLIISNNIQNVDTLYRQLKDWQKKGTLLKYDGAIKSNNILIQEMTKTHDEGGFSNAVKINFSLTNIRIVSSNFTKATNVGPKKPEKKSSNTGTYVTVKAGNTYWGWYTQYGTPIATLRSWNKWADRLIPIGAKARVK